MRAYLVFFLVSSLLLVSASGEPFRRKISLENGKTSDSTEMYTNELSVIKIPNVNCPEGQLRDRFGKCRLVFRRSAPDESMCEDEDENGTCREMKEETGDCADGDECGEAIKCEDGSCTTDGEVMQKMKEEKERKSKKDRNIALILKKKKKLMMLKPFLKPKPKPPPHDHHHHPAEPEGEDEEVAPIPDDEDVPDPPEFRMFNHEICVEKEDGTTGNCIGSSEVPEISGQNQKYPKTATKRVSKAARNADLRRVIKFLKALRMRRRLNPVLGQFVRGNIQGNTSSSLTFTTDQEGEDETNTFSICRKILADGRLRR